MKTITISDELEIQILRTPTQLALQYGAEIFLVNSIKVGRNRVYIEMTNQRTTRTQNLRTLIKKGIRFINPDGNMFTPKSFIDGMFIMPDGKKIVTGYTAYERLCEQGTY